MITNDQLNLLPIRIADSTLSASQSSFDFANLPTQFAHLLLATFTRLDVASGTDNKLRFNNDSTNVYYTEQLQGVGAVASAAEVLADSGIHVGAAIGTGGLASGYGGTFTFIPNYQSAVGVKPAITIALYSTGTTTGKVYVIQTAGFWNSVAAINRVQVVATGSNFVSGSRATIYGLA